MSNKESPLDHALVALIDSLTSKMSWNNGEKARPVLEKIALSLTSVLENRHARKDS
jgi:hypothetical protein